jgi:arylsulfatase A-like enzyme
MTLMQQALQLGLMPNLQQYLISTGTSFNRYFVSDARGCPTREGYLSGKYFHNIVSATSNHQCGVFQFNDTNTLAVWLKNSGYITSLIGKYMDGYGYTDMNGDGKVTQADAVYTPPGWTDWEAITFYQPQLTGSVPDKGIILPNDNANMYQYFMASNGSLQDYGTSPSDYQTDVLSGRAVQFLNKLPQSNTSPVFMMITPGAPHFETNYDPHPLPGYEEAFAWDIRPAPRYQGTVNTSLPMPPNFNPTDLSGKPQWIASKNLLNADDIAAVTQQWNHRLEALRAVDDLIGKVAQTLQAKGMLSSTVMLFFSDNGWMYGNWRLGGKLAPYDASIGAPLYVNRGGGVTSDAMVGFADIPATIAELAGVTPPNALDGTSFVPLLSNPNTAWRNRFLCEHWQALMGTFAMFDVPDYKAIRTGPTYSSAPNMLLVAYQQPGQINEVYDYVRDPWALNNIYSSTSPQRIQQRKIMGQYLQQLATCTGQTCHNLEFQ